MAKKAIKVYLRSAIESGFKFVKRRFENLSELNENFHAQRKWIFEKLDKKADFKQRLAKVLEVLKMHSCKYIGISFLTENRLCEAYEAQHGEPISKRSVSTYVKQLREIGFVTTISATREDGKQTANIVVIEKLGAANDGKTGSSSAKEAGKGEGKAAVLADEGKTDDRIATDGGEDRPEKPAHKEAEILHTEKTTSPSKTTVEEIKERMAKGRRLLNFVPKWFRERIVCCSRDGREVYEFWKVFKHLSKRTFGALMGADELQEVVSKAIREFYLSAKAAARGKFRMANPFGFFHTVLEAEGYAHIRREAQASSSLLYNWLED